MKRNRSTFLGFFHHCHVTCVKKNQELTEVLEEEIYVIGGIVDRSVAQLQAAGGFWR